MQFFPELVDNHSPFDDEEENNFVDQVSILLSMFRLIKLNRFTQLS